MAFTAGLTSGLTEPITKTLLEDYFYGKLTLEQMVAALGSTLWLDATSGYPLNSIAPETPALDTETVTRWLDRSGNDNHVNQVVITAMPTWLENQLNTTEDVISFDGAGDHLEISNFAEWTASTPFSYTLLVKLNDLSVTQNILGRGFNGSFNGHFLYFDQPSQKIQFKVLADSPNAGAVAPTTTQTTGQWYFIAITYDGSSDESGMQFYLNSASPTTTAANAWSGNFYGGGSLQFAVGARSDGNESFNGQLSQVKVFDKELTADEVSLIKDYYNDKYGLSL